MEHSVIVLTLSAPIARQFRARVNAMFHVQVNIDLRQARSTTDTRLRQCHSNLWRFKRTFGLPEMHSREPLYKPSIPTRYLSTNTSCKEINDIDGL